MILQQHKVTSYTKYSSTFPIIVNHFVNKYWHFKISSIIYRFISFRLQQFYMFQKYSLKLQVRRLLYLLSRRIFSQNRRISFLYLLLCKTTPNSFNNLHKISEYLQKIIWLLPPRMQRKINSFYKYYFQSFLFTIYSMMRKTFFNLYGFFQHFQITFLTPAYQRFSIEQSKKEYIQPSVQVVHLLQINSNIEMLLFYLFQTLLIFLFYQNYLITISILAFIFFAFATLYSFSIKFRRPYADGRYSGLGMNVLFRSLQMKTQGCFQGMQQLLFITARGPSKGNFLNARTQARTPKAKTSILFVMGNPEQQSLIQGALQLGVVLLLNSYLISYLFLSSIRRVVYLKCYTLLKVLPKSHILYQKSLFIRIFSIFISLWVIPLLCRQHRPFKTDSIISIILSSETKKSLLYYTTPKIVYQHFYSSMNPSYWLLMYCSKYPQHLIICLCYISLSICFSLLKMFLALLDDRLVILATTFQWSVQNMKLYAPWAIFF